MIKIYNNYKKRIEIRKIRKIIRSYNLLRKQNKIEILSKISEDLSRVKLNIEDNKFSNYFFGAANLNCEIALRQQLLFSLVYSKLNRNILLCYSENKKLISPMPKQWLKIIEDYGIKISYFWSFIYFYLFILKSFFYGIKSQFKYISDIFFNNHINYEKYIQFVDLGLSNLPLNDNDIYSHNIINWYINNRIKINKSRIIKHNVEDVKNMKINDILVTSNPSFIPILTLRNSFKFIYSLTIISIKSFIDLLSGRWWHPFLLQQSSLAKIFKFAKPGQLAEEYLFSNSNWLNRPLWTYEASSKGSKITLYFYSTNCEYLKLENNKQILPIGYHSMNWPNYLVWNTYQEKFIRNLNYYNSNIDIVGPIWFQSNKIYKTYSKNKSITIFDVSPYRDSIYSTLGVPDLYYRSDNVINFINDIIQVAIKFNFSINFKQKRNLNKLYELKYINYLEKIKSIPGLKFIDPSISAIDVIKYSDLVISIPFTSTSIIAKEYGYKTVYYDPTGNLNKNDPAAHGVKILSNIIELENWIIQKEVNY
jgi:polysaccharide biosynthesis PFTS motif protein